MFTFSPEPTPSTRRRHKNKSFKYRHTNIFPLDLLDMGQTLGKGAYGKVYKGKLRLNQDLRIEVSKKFWIVTLPQSVTFSQSFEMIPSEKLVGRLRWRRAREAPAPKTWKERLAFSWNCQQGKLTKLFSLRFDQKFQALEHCELDGGLLANWGRYAPNAFVGALWGDYSF